MQFFLPHELSPQGWLTDMLLAQLHHQENNEIREHILEKGDDSRVFKIPPELKHRLIESVQKNLKPWKGWDALRQYAPMFGSNAKWLEKKKYVDFLMNITPAQAAAFTPYMRIFVKTRPAASKDKKNDNRWEEKDIVFKTFTDINPILNDSFTRGAGAGIKKMSMKRQFTYFGASQSYYFDIDFFFSSMKTFVGGHHVDPLRGTEAGDYVKLIKNLGGQTKTCRDGKEVTIPEERLNIEYGWKIADSIPHDIIPTEIRQIVQKMERKSFALTWTNHTFSFTPTGEISLSVQYIGTPEAMMYRNTTDLEGEENDVIGLSNEIQISKIENEELQQKYKEHKEKKELLATYLKCGSANNKTTDDDKCAGKNKTKEIKKLKYDISKIKKKLVTETSQAALDYMMDRGQVTQAVFHARKDTLGRVNNHEFQINFRKIKGRQLDPIVAEPQQGYIARDYSEKAKKDPNSRQTNNKLPSQGSLIKKIIDKVDFVETKKKGKSVSSKQKELDKILTALTNSEEKKLFGNFFFFPLKALVEWAYSRSSKKKQEKLPIICLGNMVTRSLGKDYWVNIGEVLIEVGVFQRWFYDELINKERTKLTLGEFMDSVMNNLLPRVLYQYNTGYQPNTNHGKIEPHFYNASYKKIKSLFAATEKTDKNTNEPLLISLVEEINNKSDKADNVPFVYYSQRSPTDSPESESSLFFGELSSRNFQREEDHDDGMYHLTIGEDRGILQTIDFSYDDDPYRRSAQLFDKGADGVTPFLKYNYKGSARMMGNNLFSKPPVFFVIANNPLGIRKEDDPGLLGYYQLNEVSDHISPGQYYTIVNGVNMLSGEKMVEKKKNKADKPKKLETFVEHEISDYIVNDLLQSPHMDKNYRLKRKKEEKKDDCPVGSKAPQKPAVEKKEPETTSLAEQREEESAGEMIEEAEKREEELKQEAYEKLIKTDKFNYIPYPGRKGR